MNGNYWSNISFQRQDLGNFDPKSMCFGFQFALRVVLQIHQLAQVLPGRKDLFCQLIHLLIQGLISYFFLPECRILFQVFISQQLEVLLHSSQLILQQENFLLRFCNDRSCGMIGSDHVIELFFQFLLKFYESDQLLLYYIVCLFHLCQSQPMLLSFFLLIQCLPFAECQCSPQSLFLLFFFLSLQSQSFKFILEIVLLILQLADLCPQLLNDQFIAVPPLDQALQLVLLLHKLFISQLDSKASIFVVIADTAINSFQCLQLIFQAFSLIFDDLIVLFYPFGLSQSAFNVNFQPLYLFVIEVLGDKIISCSFYLSGFVLKLLDPLAQLQVILLLFLQRLQLLLQLTHALIPIVPPNGLTKSLSTHFDYSFKMIALSCKQKEDRIGDIGMEINWRSCG